jgi:hypothetical protein
MVAPFPDEIGQFQRAQAVASLCGRADHRSEVEAQPEEDDREGQVKGKEGTGGPVERIPCHQFSS